MTKAICTPTATCAEFVSILMELDGVGVKWKSGGVPTANKNYWENSNSKLSYNWYGEKELTMCGAGLEQLPRAEFISAIKRDFGKETIQCCGNEYEVGTDWYCAKCDTSESDISKMETTGDGPIIDCSYPTEIKEQPKMNLNKMTKAELIVKLKGERGNISFLEVEMKKRDREISELKAKWTAQDEVISNRDNALEFVRGTADEQGKKILDLEKTNAEQAETIENIRNRSISIEEVARMAQDERDKANYALRIANAENTRIKRLAAQILCADVLEGE